MWFTLPARSTPPAGTSTTTSRSSTHSGVLPSARMVGIGLPGGPASVVVAGLPGVAGQCRSSARCSPALPRSRCAHGAGPRRPRHEAHREPPRAPRRCARVRARGRRRTAWSRWCSRGGASGDASPRCSGPGPVTVRLVVQRQPLLAVAHPRPPAHRVDASKCVNRDFINHEFIIGGDDVPRPPRERPRARTTRRCPARCRSRRTRPA